MNAILEPLEWVVAAIMVSWHKALTTIGMPASSGWTWALSIVGLVVVIRIALIPLFVKQIKASRGLQLIQPQMKKVQEKYKGKTDQASRQAMSQEMMALYRENGTNPFASCLPILLQAPIFFALFRVLNGIASNPPKSIGWLTPELAEQAQDAAIFGAPLSDTFLGADTWHTKVVCVVLIILMSLTTFTTQHQLMRKNMPAAALEGPFAQQQKLLLYILPLVFAVSGVNFPIGVLIYWSTTNLWSMGQQFYVIRRMPAPGSAAEAALKARREAKGKDPVDTPVVEVNPVTPQGQRQQPKRQPKSRRKGAAGQGARSSATTPKDDPEDGAASGAPQAS